MNEINKQYFKLSVHCYFFSLSVSTICNGLNPVGCWHSRLWPRYLKLKKKCFCFLTLNCLRVIAVQIMKDHHNGYQLILNNCTTIFVEWCCHQHFCDHWHKMSLAWPTFESPGCGLRYTHMHNLSIFQICSDWFHLHLLKQSRSSPNVKAGS